MNGLQNIIRPGLTSGLHAGLEEGMFDGLQNEVNTNKLLLNDFPGASIAYSVRKINANYNGPCIRVRRVSDNAEADIFFDGNNNLNEAALLNFSENSDTRVIIFYDQSGNNNNISNNSQPPRICNLGVVEKLGIRPCIFTGVASLSWLFNNSLKLPLINRSSFFVMRMNEQRTDGGVYGLNPPSGFNDFNSTQAFEFQSRNFDLNFQYGFFGSTGISYYLQKSGNTTTTIPYSIISEIKSIQNGRLYENKSLIISDTSFTEFQTLSHGGFVIGARYFNNNTIDFPTNISFQEFIYWGSNQITNFDKIHSNINNYYKIY